MSLAPFVVWAPIPAAVDLDDQAGRGDVGTERVADGAGTRRAGGIPPGRCPSRPASGVRLRLPCSTARERSRCPDPRSRRQPDGVHGWSRTYDPDTFTWTDQCLDRTAAGRRGDLRAARRHLHRRRAPCARPIDRLDHLVRLGVDFVELMPVNAFNGPHNWGYDGVLWYAVQETVRRARGLPGSSSTPATPAGSAVIQDVVYNHLGPSGNYLPSSGPT